MKSRVSIVKCLTYDPEQVSISLDRALGLLGGLGAFVKKGEKVLIKPNMLSARPPEYGANTNIEVVRACVGLVKKQGAVPVIADNPGGSITPRQAYEGSGLLKIAEQEGIECLEKKDVRMVNGFPIASYFFECDKIISIPKMKTHSLMGLTGAVKNMYGAVVGLNKTELHKKFPKPEEFARIIVDVFQIVRPYLVLMDGIVAMEGDGPAAGPLRKAGILLAGQDSVAVDSVFAGLIGVDPFGIITTKEAAKRGLGEADPANIEILGESLQDSAIQKFKLPRSSMLLNLHPGIMRLAASFIKFGPFIDKKLCKKCMVCAKTCPVSAITINNRDSKIDRKECIRCMCCHEVCPYNAVKLKRNILARGFGL
ncbi:MAG TPA: DUF362 domain-containing protein [Candidatus Omnitrophica bacterium]|nr:DUF362 domain-containing protein [Candidatus Omnitrophota bacterium]